MKIILKIIASEKEEGNYFRNDNIHWMVWKGKYREKNTGEKILEEWSIGMQRSVKNPISRYISSQTGHSAMNSPVWCDFIFTGALIE